MGKHVFVNYPFPAPSRGAIAMEICRYWWTMQPSLTPNPHYSLYLMLGVNPYKYITQVNAYLYKHAFMLFLILYWKEIFYIMLLV